MANKLYGVFENGVAERVQLMKMAEVQGRINTINKEFKNA